MDAILSDFRQKMNREDIVIRFYEDFLAAYKPQMRERRGVYYTPEPVVSYMVRSVDEMLKDKFNKAVRISRSRSNDSRSCVWNWDVFIMDLPTDSSAFSRVASSFNRGVS